MFSEIYDQCFSCKKKKLFVRKRKIQLPLNQTANSREKFCTKCFKELQEQVKKNHE